ncbi:MAG TPA: hypothetical protein VG753_02690 [Candidatus Paceibacterota bacterium]|nr:hypothetical protein [Candidatus Paceibacterota bacterium]
MLSSSISAHASQHEVYRNKYAVCIGSSSQELQVQNIAYRIFWRNLLQGTGENAQGSAEVSLLGPGMSPQRYRVTAVAVPTAATVPLTTTEPTVAYRGIVCTAHHPFLVGAGGRQVSRGGAHTSYIAKTSFFGVERWFKVSVDIRSFK